MAAVLFSMSLPGVDSEAGDHAAGRRVGVVVVDEHLDATSSNHRISNPKATQIRFGEVGAENQLALRTGNTGVPEYNTVVFVVLHAPGGRIGGEHDHGRMSGIGKAGETE